MCVCVAGVGLKEIQTDRQTETERQRQKERIQFPMSPRWRASMRPESRRGLSSDSMGSGRPTQRERERERTPLSVVAKIEDEHETQVKT